MAQNPGKVRQEKSVFSWRPCFLSLMCSGDSYRLSALAFLACLLILGPYRDLGARMRFLLFSDD